MRASRTAPDEAPASEPSLFQGFAGEDWSLRAWLRLLRDLYCTFDRRTLGFARIMLGFLLVTDLIHRSAAWRDMYSSVGVLPTPLNLLRPGAFGAFSIFNGFVTPGELQVLWVVMFVNAVCLMVGYRTRVAQMIALVLHVGMNGRVLLIENGGYVVNNILLLWTMFLPLGDRFSVDAFLASLRRRRETAAADLNDRGDMLAPGMDTPHVSVVGLVLMVQIAAIYYFNVIHKTGPAWRNGTAVHYVLYVDRMTTPIVSDLRAYVPSFLLVFMTRSTMAFEAAIPVLLLQPLARTWARRGVVFMMCTLHLAFGVTFVLGPFAWSLCVFACLLFSREDWEVAIAAMRRPRRARTVLFDPRSGGALLVCRLLKRMDRFELLRFAEREGLPLGLGIEGQTSRAAMLADLVEALPLGPTLAWVPRLPGVSGLFEAALAALEKRDVSGFFGLRVEGGPGSAGSAAPVEGAVDPRPPALAVVYGAFTVGDVARDLGRRLAAWVADSLPGLMPSRDVQAGVTWVIQAGKVVVSFILVALVMWLRRALPRLLAGAVVGPEPSAADWPVLPALVVVGVIIVFMWVGGPSGRRPPETTVLEALACALALLAVPGAVILALYLDEPLPGVLLVLASAAVAGVASAWVAFPVVTVATLRRAAFGSVRELIVLAMFAGAVNQAMVELWCINKRVHVGQPEALRLLSNKMRFLQGWFMFSPNPITEDGTIVVDALTVDGRHVDPFTARPPSWEMGKQSLGLTQIWCDYFNRIQLPANSAYREAMKDYMYRLPQRTGRPADAIVSGEVYWVRQNNPRWNEHHSYGYERAKLFSFENPAAQPRASR